MTTRAPLPRLAGAGLLAVSTLLVLPATASAHQLTGRYESPLPLVAYLAAAAIAVALSFAIVILRDRPAAPSENVQPSEVVVPPVLRLGFRAIGLVGWLWITAQALIGTAGDGDVGSLFLWTYGWVALPILSAFVGPIWEWLDPFRTLHDLGAIVVRRLRLPSWTPVPYPGRLERWPAVATFVLFVWLELVYTGARAGRPLGMVLLLYTAWTLLMMAQFGRETWRRSGETFSVWLGLLNRLAPLGPADEDAGRLVVRSFGSGARSATWAASDLALIAVATGSILFDGISQTQIWFDAFGTPALPAATVQMLIFLGAIVGLVFLVARVVGVRAMAAGLLPIALGYLIAHYCTALIFDGQRILNALSDPFGLGWNLFGTADYEPSQSWLPSGIVWAIQLIAVVGGHVYGAIAGHRASLEAAAPTVTDASARSRPGAVGASDGADARLRQVPLALVMVFLTALTLWSLGQAVVQQAS